MKREEKLKKTFYQITMEKCLTPENARHWEIYTAMSSFVDEEKIKSNLVLHFDLCFNPFAICNNLNPCVCIFNPSNELFKKYNFIKKKYSWGSRVPVYYYIDLDEFNNYQKKYLSISEEDIVSLNYRYLHPYYRGAIQNNKFDLFFNQYKHE